MDTETRQELNQIKAILQLLLSLVDTLGERIDPDYWQDAKRYLRPFNDLRGDGLVL